MINIFAIDTSGMFYAIYSRLVFENRDKLHWRLKYPDHCWFNKTNRRLYKVNFKTLIFVCLLSCQLNTHLAIVHRVMTINIGRCYTYLGLIW
jgi:hypothetical protein